MAEDQGKEEEKFDSTREGEAVGHISLPRAVIYARLLAREDDEYYKDRLGWTEVVWTELHSESIGEDFYKVILQFRRPGRGIPEEQIGEVEFLFDLTGTLQDRQVLHWPEGADTTVPSALSTPLELPTAEPEVDPSQIEIPNRGLPGVPSGINQGESPPSEPSFPTMLTAQKLHPLVAELKPGEICTIAGNGKKGYSGDGEPAIQAMLNEPYDVAVDELGNIYIADSGNHRIRKVSVEDMTIDTEVGTGVKGFSGDGINPRSAQLDRPRGIDFDKFGNLYIADKGNHRVHKVDSGSQTVETVAGTGKAGHSGQQARSAELDNPESVSVDRATGRVYITGISTRGAKRVRMVDESGIIHTFAGAGSVSSQQAGLATKVKFSRNNDLVIAAGSGGTVYIGEQDSYTLYMVSDTGIITPIVGVGKRSVDVSVIQVGTVLPQGLAFHARDRVIFINDGGSINLGNKLIRKLHIDSGNIVTVAGDGKAGFEGDGGPATSARFRKPRGLAVDSYGNLYIADADNHRVRVIRNP